MHRLAIFRTLPVFLLISASAAFGQSFDVASVKVSQPGPGAGEGGRGRRGLKITPGSVTVQNMPLGAIVQWAYNVQPYQVTGPDWTNNQTFDIFAKAAGTVQEPELRAMMQTLLADRFKLVIHREIKELPVYEMTIAKGGHKLTSSASEGESNFGPPKGGGGKMAVHADRTSMAQWADLLSQPLQSPVVDKTGLKGNFDFSVDLMNYIPLDANGKQSPESVPETDRATIVMMAIQQQLGLKLDLKKGPIDRIVIDSADKIPTEN